MALPNLPVQGQNPWFTDRNNWDLSVESELGGRLSESTLNATYALKSEVLPGSTSIFNVLDYGAVGNGVTDDTAGIQAALDAADSVGGGVIQLPPRQYYIQTGVHLRDNISIQGYGAVILKRSASDWLTSFYTLSFRGAGYGGGASNWSISGIRFQGIPGVRACVISLHHAQDYAVRDCMFTDCQLSTHVMDMQGCSRGVIENCRFLGYIPGEIDKEAIQIDHSYRGGGPLLPESSANYSRYDGLGCRDITVRGCSSGRSPNGGEAPNLVGSHSYLPTWHRRILVEDNTIEVTIPQHVTSSSRRGAVHFVCASDVRVINNTFNCVGSATQTPIRFRSTNTGFPSGQWQTATPVPSSIPTMHPSGLEVSGNLFSGFNSPENGNLVHFMGLEDLVTNGRQSGVTISDNVFRGSFSSTGETDGMNQLYLSYVENATVVGNSSDGFRQLVYAEKCKNLSVSNNTGSNGHFIAMRSTGGSGVSFSGNLLDSCNSFLLVEGGSTNTQITNNTFSGNTGVRPQAIWIRGSSVGFSITGNIIRGSGGKTVGVLTEGTSTGGGAFANLVSADYTTPFSTESGSSVTVSGTVTA